MVKSNGHILVLLSARSIRDLADDLGLDEIRGVYIDGLVEGGGAMDAGIEIGDVITMVNGMDVNSLAQLLEVVGQHSPGQKLDVEVLRHGSPLSFGVELRAEDGTTDVIKRGNEFFNERLGASFIPLTSEEKNTLGIRSGLKVINMEGRILNKGGIRNGFVVTTVNGYETDSESALVSALRENTERVKISGIYHQRNEGDI